MDRQRVGGGRRVAVEVVRHHVPAVDQREAPVAHRHEHLELQVVHQVLVQVVGIEVVRARRGGPAGLPGRDPEGHHVQPRPGEVGVVHTVGQGAGGHVHQAALRQLRHRALRRAPGVLDRQTRAARRAVQVEPPHVPGRARVGRPLEREAQSARIPRDDPGHHVAVRLAA